MDQLLTSLQGVFRMPLSVTMNTLACLDLTLIKPRKVVLYLTLVIAPHVVTRLPVLMSGSNIPVHVLQVQQDQIVWIFVTTTILVRILLSVGVHHRICMVTIVSVESYRVGSIVMRSSYNLALITGMDILSVDPVTAQVRWDSLVTVEQ